MNHLVRANRKRKKKKRVFVDPEQYRKTMEQGNLMIAVEMVHQRTGISRDALWQGYRLAKDIGLVDTINKKMREIKYNDEKNG